MVGNRVQLSCILIKTDGKSDQYAGGIDIQNATILIILALIRGDSIAARQFEILAVRPESKIDSVLEPTRMLGLG